MSVVANIAEGSGRRTDPAARAFLEIALGSATEVECLLLICAELGHLPEGRHSNLQSAVQSVRRMLNSFIRRLRHTVGRRQSQQ